MGENRDLTLLEKRTLIYALAQERTASFTIASELRERAAEIEDAGECGYVALEDEAARYENLAGALDDLIGLVCEGRVVILKRGE